MNKEVEKIVEKFGLECPDSSNCKNYGTLSEHDSPSTHHPETGECLTCPIPVQCEFCYREEKSKMNLRDAIDSLLQEDKRGKNKCKHETVHDLFERYICNNCGELFFDNPKQ